MMRGEKICIVTTRHISYNPRVLKEADALCAAGYEVVVVAVDNNLQQHAFDVELMAPRKWTLKTVDFRKTGGIQGVRWIGYTIRQKLCSALTKLSFRYGIAERAGEKGFDGLTRLAKAQKADLYIVHHAEALGAGAAAARHNKTDLGFDAEDFHRGMNGMDARAVAMIGFLEAKYLPHCIYVSAASRGIAEGYRREYGIKDPLTLLNVFPLEPIDAIRLGTPPRFYWYSQVIGPHRGLEGLMEAAGRLTAPFEVHLRGTMQQGYRPVMDELIQRHRLEGKIFFHDPILAAGLIPEASRYDVGLALEMNTSENAMVAVSNKLFSYLVSGLAVIATDTDGQKDILRSFPDAGILCKMDDPQSLAATMQCYLDDPDRLLGTRMAARSAAENGFNWEKESGKLVACVERILGKKNHE
ncbi:MAG TPA: glycosyltransferase [Puia sp.]|nr:glycosyltransferase [Puia sp.]